MDCSNKAEDGDDSESRVNISNREYINSQLSKSVSSGFLNNDDLQVPQPGGLDSFNSFHICNLVTLPLLLALSCFIIPSLWKVDSFIAELEVGRNSNYQSIQLPNDVNSLGFVQSSFSVDAYNISQYVCSRKELAANSNLVWPSTYDGDAKITAYLWSNISLLSELSSYVVHTNDFSIVGGDNCSSAAQDAIRGDKARLYVPLQMQGLDLPVVLSGQPRWVTFNITASAVTLPTWKYEEKIEGNKDVSLISNQDDSASESSLSANDTMTGNLPFFMLRYTVVTQNRIYALVAAIIMLLLSLGTLVCIVYLSYKILRLSGCKQYIYSKWLQYQRIPSTMGDNFDSMGHVAHVTAEQYTSLLLLVFLLMWQNPLRATCIIAHYVSIHALTDSLLLLSGLSGALASYGLQFAMIVYVNGLKYNTMGRPSAGDISRTSPRQRYPSDHLARPSTAFSSAVPLSWTVQPGTESVRPSTDSTPLYLPSRDESPVAQTNNNNNNSMWFEEPTRGNSPGGDVNRRQVIDDPPAGIRIWNSLLLLVITWIVVSAYWLLKFPSLCSSQLLPFSMRGNGFKYSSFGGNYAYMAVYIVLESVVILLSLVWIYSLVSMLYSTARRLNKSRFMKNRFHQIAYVLLLTQINLGVIVLAIVVLHELAVIHVFSSGYYQLGSSPYLWIRYSVWWFEYYGGLRAIASAAPTKAPQLELMLFVSALVYIIVYLSAYADNGVVVTAESYTSSNIDGNRRKPSLTSATSIVNLERHLATKSHLATDVTQLLDRRSAAYQQLKRSLIERKYVSFLKRYVNQVQGTKDRHPFCLETACLLLEASYQTYFPVKVSQAQTVSVNSTTSEAPSAVSYGPHLTLSRLNLQLCGTFADPLFSTFGYLGEAVHLNRAVAAFRGSTLANITTDFKFALIALPDLNCSRKYFVDILRNHSSSSNAHENTQDGGVFETSFDVDMLRGSGSSSDTLQNSNECPPRLSNFDHSVSIDEENIAKIQAEQLQDEAELTRTIDGGRVSLLDRIRALGSHIPLVNHGFPRVHAGFWAAYASIREQFMKEAVLAIARHRHSHLSITASHSKEELFTQPSHDLETGERHTKVHFGDIEMQSTPLGSHRTSYGTASLDMEEDSADQATSTAAGSADSASMKSELQLEFSEMEPLRFSITGHSLGGAMALLAALDLATNMPTIVEALCCEDYFRPTLEKGLTQLSQLRAWTAPVIVVYIYGCPRLGNTALMMEINSKLPTLYRVQVNGDLVTMIPKIGSMYRHSGKTVVVDDEESGGLIVDPSILEQVFLRRTTGTLANHSLDRYRVCLEACFERDDLQEYLTNEFHAVSGNNVTLQSAATVPGAPLLSMPEWLVNNRI